jgi:Flp pilus assembly protein CpaB
MLTLSTLVVLLTSAGPAPKGPPTLVPRARAWSIETAAVQGAPLLKVGDHIDVLAVITDPDSKQLTSVMLLQNVIVLSNKPVATPGPAFISLLVIPEEAELLTLARAAGTLTFIQRESTDIDILEQGKPVTLKALLGH